MGQEPGGEAMRLVDDDRWLWLCSNLMRDDAASLKPAACESLS
jgi:hypothetical protein